MHKMWKKKTVVRISLILGYHKQKLVKISFLIEMMIDYATIFLLIGANYNKWSMFSWCEGNSWWIEENERWFI